MTNQFFHNKQTNAKHTVARYSVLITPSSDWVWGVVRPPSRGLGVGLCYRSNLLLEYSASTLASTRVLA